MSIIKKLVIFVNYIINQCSGVKLQCMSGHSKWSTIKHKKAARDHVRGNVFTKMAKAISVAVKKGGGVGDPEINFALRLAIAKARAVNMPMENIKRAMESGMGRGSGGELNEVLVEGFAKGGEALLIEAVTDNSNRTINELRVILEKREGRMGVSGSAACLFDRVGVVEYRGLISENDQLALIDLGAIEFVEQEGCNVIYTESTKTKVISDFLGKQADVAVDEVGLIYKPKVIVSSQELANIQELIEALEDHDDVQEVFANV